VVSVIYNVIPALRCGTKLMFWIRKLEAGQGDICRTFGALRKIAYEKFPAIAGAIRAAS